MTRTLDEQERKIIKALIRNPRESDNQISKLTKVPVMTVNRKRRKLEQEQLIQYYTSLRRGEDGMQLFEAQQLYIIKLRTGITKAQYTTSIERDLKNKSEVTQFVNMSFLGERDGHLAVIIMMGALSKTLLTEEFNGKIIPFLQQKLGTDVIEKVDAVPIMSTLRLHHNYLPNTNMKDGTITADWPDEFLFVDEVGEPQRRLGNFYKNA